MGLINVMVGFLVIKGIMLWPFYYHRKLWPLLVGFLSSLAVAPLLTVLYHDTDLNFWLAYIGLITLDTFLYSLLLQRVWWKAILISFFLNTIVIVYFFLGNG